MVKTRVRHTDVRQRLYSGLCALGGLAIAVASVVLVWVLYGLIAGVDPLLEVGFYSLAVSVLTLEATIAIALVVFRLQGRREVQRQAERSRLAAELISADLEIAFRYLLLVPDGAGMPGAAAPLRGGFDAHVADLKRILSADSLRTLIMVVSATQDPSLVDDERFVGGGLPDVALPFVKEQLRPVAHTSYASLLKKVSDWRDLLSSETFALMGELTQVCGGSLGAYRADRTIFADEAGTPVIEFDPTTERYRIHSGDVLLCDGTIAADCVARECPVRDGFARTPGYVGDVREGRRHGAGMSISKRDGHPIAKGEWVEGELVSGVEFDWIVAIPEDISLDDANSDDMCVECTWSKWIQLGNERFASSRIEDIAREAALQHLPSVDDECAAALNGLKILYVADVKIEDGTEQLFNIRKIEDELDITVTYQPELCEPEKTRDS